jgi:hypothetical protein
MLKYKVTSEVILILQYTAHIPQGVCAIDLQLEHQLKEVDRGALECRSQELVHNTRSDC